MPKASLIELAMYGLTINTFLCADRKCVYFFSYMYKDTGKYMDV